MSTHISNFGIENFRVFKNHTHFEFAPITVLVGSNGSGKTSLMTACSIVKDYFSPDLAKLFHDQIGGKSLIDKIGLIKDNISKQLDDNYITISITVAPSSISNPLTADIKLAVRNDAKGLAKVDTIDFKDSEGSLVFKVTSDGRSDYGEAIVNFGLLHQCYKAEFLRARLIKDGVENQEKDVSQIKLGYMNLHKSYFGVYPYLPRPSFLINVFENQNLLNWDPIDNGYCFNFSELREFSALLNSHIPPITHSLNLASKGDQAICSVLSKGKIEVRLGEFAVFERLIDSKDNSIQLGRFSVLDKVIYFFRFDRRSLTNEFGEFYDPALASLYTPTSIDFENFAHNPGNIDSRLLFQKYQLILSSVSNLCNRISITDHEEMQALALLVLYRLEFDLYCEKKQLTNSEALTIYRGESLVIGDPGKSFFGYIEAYLTALSNEIANFSKLKIDVTPLQKAEIKRRSSIFDDSNIVEGIAEYINSADYPWKQRKLEAALSFAIKLFEFGQELKVDSSKGEFAIWIKRNEATFVNLVDCGLGIRRVVELVFQLLPKGLNCTGVHPETGEALEDLIPQVIHLEEPEANLHPAFQSKLADLMVYISKNFNTQFIIETHSEYLIRKLQYLTAKKEIKPEHTVIYYFYPPDHPDVVCGREPQVKKININDDGSLTGEFGSGFFDEADNIALELFLLKKSQEN